MNHQPEEQNPKSIVENLMSKAEAYYSLSLEVSRLKTVEKVSLVATQMIAKFVLMLVAFILLITFSMGLAFFMGELLGKVYFGFLVVSGIYILILVYFYFYLYDLLLEPVSKLFYDYLKK